MNSSIIALIAISGYSLFICLILYIFGSQKRQIKRIHCRLMRQVIHCNTFTELCELEVKVEAFYHDNYFAAPEEVARMSCVLHEAIHQRTVEFCQPAGKEPAAAI